MPVQGEEPLEGDLEWLKYGREMIKDSPKVLDEASKSFLALGSSLLTVYTGALALFKLNEKASGILSWTIICVPILLWLLCISFFAYVYFPDRIKFNAKSPTDIENATRHVSQDKSIRLKIGSYLFVAALFFTSISIVWLGVQPAKEAQTEAKIAQFAVAEDEVKVLNNQSGLLLQSALSPHPFVVLSAGNQTYILQKIEKVNGS
jgi:hypothetical protein